MGDSVDTIEFTIEELAVLHAAKDVAHVIKIAFLFGSDEAFHALCSLVRNAKDMSSTSKRIKRDARINFYNGLVETQFPHLSNFSERNLTYLEFGAACQTFSDRWTSQYLLDELVSLAFIIDKEETGEISLDVFMEFIEDVDRAFHSNPSNPIEALEDLYDTRREVLFRYVMEAFPSLELRTKLASLASVACQLNIQPLCTLIDLVETDIDPQAEDVIGFVIQLTGTVNQGIKDIQAAEALASLEQSVAESATHHTHHTTHSSHHHHSNHHSSHHGSRHSPNQHSPHRPHHGAHRGLQSGEISPIGSTLSSADLSMSMSEHLDRLTEDHALDQSYSSTHQRISSEHTVPQYASHTNTTESNNSGTSLNSFSPLGIAQLDSTSELDENKAQLDAESLLLSINTFQAKAQEFAMALTASAATPANTDSSQSEKSTKEEPESLSVQVPEASSPTPSSAPSISNEALLEQIQLMEAELQRAKTLLSSSLPSTPATTHSNTQLPISGKHSMPPLYSSAFSSPGKPPHPEAPGSAVRRSSITSESGDRRRYSISSCDASIRSSQMSPRSPRTISTGASRRPSLSTGSAADWTNTMKLLEPSPAKRNGTPGRVHSSSPTEGSHAHHPHSHPHGHNPLNSSTRSVGSLGLSFAHSHAHTLNSTFNSTAAAYTPSKLVSLSLKKGKSVGSTGKLDRSSPLAKHVDLSIFKSPISHRRPDAKNVFDGEKQTWVSSVSKKLGSAAKRDRFSTTYDLMIAREVNPVFFDN